MAKMRPNAPRPTDPLASAYPVAPPVQRASITALESKIHIEDPEVAAHTARVILKHNFDFTAAVHSMLPKVNASDCAIIASFLQRAPALRQALNELYKTIGYDDAAQERYISVLWEWFLSGSQRQKSDAAKLMGQMFGLSEKSAEVGKITDLPLRNLGAGLKKMGLDDDTLTKVKRNPTGFGKIDKEDDEPEDE